MALISKKLGNHIGHKMGALDKVDQKKCQNLCHEVVGEELLPWLYRADRSSPEMKPLQR